jgi:CheY-like chemotaxis protein
MTRSSILIVARDQSVRDAFLRSIAARGWSDVAACGSAADAVQNLVRGVFGLAIVHADVADMSGLQSVPVIKAADPHVRILFATADSTADLETRARDLGIFYYYIYDTPDSDELAAAVEGAVGAAPQERRDSPTILTVDDDPGFQQSLRAILESHGFRMLAAATIKEGLEIVRAERPDLVLLDIMMESATDGFLFSREVRRDPHVKHTPILALSAIGKRGGSAYSPREDEDLFSVDGFLDKPVAPDALLRRIGELLGKGKAR